MFVNDIFSKKLNEGSEPRFLDDDFYAYDPDTKEIKDTWSHKSSGRRFAENRAREMGWSVVSGMRARSLDLHYPTKKVDDPLDEDWKKVNRRDKTPGMSRKAVKAYRRENPGSKLQTAVTTKPSKLKKGSKSAKRRKSFCARMSGMKKSRASAKTKRNPDSPINKALRRWNCESIEEMRDLIMIAEQRISAMREGGFAIPEIPRAPQPRPEPKNKTVDEGSVQDKLYKRHQELRKKRGAPDPEYFKELGQSYDIEDDQERHARQAEIKKKYKVKESADGSVKYKIELDKGKKDYLFAKPDKPGEKVTPDPATTAAFNKNLHPYRKVKSVKVFDKPKEEKTQMKAVVANEDCERYVEELGRAGYDIVTETATLCPECGRVAYADRMLAEKQDACYHKVKSRYKVWPSAYASGALVRCRKKGAANWGNKSKK